MSGSIRWGRAASILLATGLVFVALGACDQFTGSSPESEGPDARALTFSHMPMGAMLPSPGEVPLERGMVRPDQEPTTRAQPRLPRSKSKTKKAGTPSPYGCYLASRPYSEAVAFRSVYLYFPRAMVKAAGEKTQRMLFSLQAAEAGPRNLAEADTAAVMEQAGEVGVRYAHCVVPDAEGAKALANEQLVRYRESEATVAALQSADSSSAGSKNTRCYVEEATVCIATIGCHTEYTITCMERPGGGLPPGGDDDGSTGGYPPSGDGPTGGGSSPPDDEDCNSTKGMLKRLDPGTQPGPGSECPPEEPPDDEVNEAKVCPGDPLKDMDIRPTCAGIEGGRYGEDARTNAQGEAVPHWGLDVGGSDAEIGTEITPVEGGTVVSSGAYSEDFGNYVIIRSGNVWYLYAHLSKVTVQDLESVGTKDKIGEMGKSGNARDAECNLVHLHLEVRKDEESWPQDEESKRKDPEKYIGTEFSDDGQPVSDKC